MGQTLSFGWYDTCEIDSSGRRRYGSEFRSNGITWGRWSFNIASLQTLRAGRTATVTGVTVGWQASSKYNEIIYISANDPNERGEGVNIGSAAGPSSKNYADVSLSTASSSVCAYLAEAINSGANFLYVSALMWSAMSGNGYCRNGSLYIAVDFEETPPSTDIVQLLLPSVSRTSFGASLNYQLTVKNTSTTKTVNKVVLRYVRYYDNTHTEDVAQPKTINLDSPISSQQLRALGTLDVSLYPLSRLTHTPGRSSAVKLIVSISGAELETVSQEVDFLTVLDRFYNPTVNLFKVVRGEDGEPNDDGTQQLTDIRIALDTDDDIGNFTLIAYYDGAQPGDESPNKIDFGLTAENLAEFKAGYIRSPDLITDGIGTNTSRRYTVYLSDGVETSVALSWSITAAHVEIELSGLKTGGVSFGKHSESTEGNPLFESAYPGRFYDGMQITGSENVSGDSTVGGQLSVGGDIVAEGALTIGSINGCDYSTDEMKTPFKWIDGKPIWRCVIQFTTTVASSVVADLAPLGMDAIVRMTGVVGGNILPMYVKFSDDDYIYVNIDLTNMKLCCKAQNGYGGQSGHVILEYTKTTDS